MSSWVMWEVSIADLHVELRESPSIHGKRYTLVLSRDSLPGEYAIVHLGHNRGEAAHLFNRKVDVYRTMLEEGH